MKREKVARRSCMHQSITRDADVLPGSPMSWGTVLAALRTPISPLIRYLVWLESSHNTVSADSNNNNKKFKPWLFTPSIVTSVGLNRIGTSVSLVNLSCLDAISLGNTHVLRPVRGKDIKNYHSDEIGEGGGGLNYTFWCISVFLQFHFHWMKYITVYLTLCPRQHHCHLHGATATTVGPQWSPCTCTCVFTHALSWTELLMVALPSSLADSSISRSVRPHPPLKTPVDALSWTCWSQSKTAGQNDHQKWLAPQKIWSVEELETLPARTKPRTSYHCFICRRQT